MPDDQDLGGVPTTEENERLLRVYDRRQRTLPPLRDTYFDRGNLFTIQDRERCCLSILRRHGITDLSELRILEVGCGSGHWLRQFISWGARPELLSGVDLIPQRVEDARRLCPSSVDIRCADAAALPYEDATFDLVLQSTVFSSIRDSELRRQVAAEMLRTLRPGGGVLWFDLARNNPSNPDVGGISASSIRALFPECQGSIDRITLAPPLARAIAPRAWWLCSLLRSFLPLRTHYLAYLRNEVSEHRKRNP